MDLPALNQRSEQKAISAKAPRREEALAAIEAECEQLRRNHVFSAPIAYEDIPEDHKQNVLRTFMFVVDKYNADLQYTRSKARLVANGATQAAHTHGPVASPVMSGFSVKLMLAMAARRGLKVASMDRCSGHLKCSLFKIIFKTQYVSSVPIFAHP